MGDCRNDAELNNLQDAECKGEAANYLKSRYLWRGLRHLRRQLFTIATVATIDSELRGIGLEVGLVVT